jgi:hypothetical protein
MKSSTISNPFALSGNADAAALTERIMPAPVYRGTYNAIVGACLLAFSDPALVIVDTRLRTVTCAKATETLSEAVNGMALVSSHLDPEDNDIIITTLAREVVPSNPDERSAGIIVKELNPGGDELGNTVTSGVTVPEGQSAFDAALDASLGAQDTAKSLGTLADAIADAMEAQNRDGYIVFDQLAQKARFYAKPVGTDDLAQTPKQILDAATANSTLAVFNVAVPEVTAPVGFFGV